MPAFATPFFTASAAAFAPLSIASAAKLIALSWMPRFVVSPYEPAAAQRHVLAGRHVHRLTGLVDDVDVGGARDVGAELWLIGPPRSCCCRRRPSSRPPP
jgi:hypothetical protein